MKEWIEIKRALISCWDKTGLLPFATALVGQGVEIVSSGGTARFLKENGLPVTEVSEVTRFPELLDGRVKTLHPAIHGGILARRIPEHLQQLEAQGIQPIDLVVVNLYPFLSMREKAELTTEEMVEFIDIGGPTMLRAAAKNFRHVVALHQPAQYQPFLESWKSHDYRFPVTESRKLAAEIFFTTAYYDAQIADYLTEQEEEEGFLEQISFFFQKEKNLRYGENPHQRAALYRPMTTGERKVPEQLWGREMSFNNYVDVSAAAALAQEFQEPFVAIIKHTNPCGAASAASVSEAFDRALAGDPLSAFGGIVATNRPVDEATAEKIAASFYECVIAPEYHPGALKILQKKKNLRLLRHVPSGQEAKVPEAKFLPFGMLLQEPDTLDWVEEKLESVGARQPEKREREDLFWAWKVVKYVKSNAIVLVKNRQVLGVGAGQMSRVDAVKIAISKAREAGHNLQGAVLASDAFFPFPDGVEVAAEAGVSAIIQPGGSIRDAQVVETARKLNLAMLLTHIRHFKH